MSHVSARQRSSGRFWFAAALAGVGLGLAIQRYRDEQARQNWRASRTTGNPHVALVTGASSGIGKCFAQKLAERRHNLILVARREERLNAVAEELGQRYGIAAEVLVADLTNSADLERVAQRIKLLDALELLVNNAGFGITKPFATSEIDKQIEMIKLHAIANVRLMRAALPAMIARQHGGIINVSSTAAFFPLPNNANYAATKAYLNVFTEALHYELQGTGVRVQALCPGFTYTEFHDQFDNVRRSEIPEFLWMPAGQVVEESLDALETGRVVYIPGIKNQLIAMLGHSGLVSGLAARFMR